jgi:hypothetical protein
VLWAHGRLQKKPMGRDVAQGTHTTCEIFCRRESIARPPVQQEEFFGEKSLPRMAATPCFVVAGVYLSLHKRLASFMPTTYILSPWACVLEQTLDP